MLYDRRVVRLGVSLTQKLLRETLAGYRTGAVG